MILSARFLDSVCSANNFRWVSRLEFTEGDGPLLYLQLVDSSLDRASDGFKPAGRRYLPASGATLQVVFINIDDAKKVTRFATQPFASDSSIWSVQLMATDTIRGTPQLSLTLTEGPVIRTGLINQAVMAHPKSNLTPEEMNLFPSQSTFP